MIGAGVVSVACTIALAACSGNSGMVPSSPSTVTAPESQSAPVSQSAPESQNPATGPVTDLSPNSSVAADDASGDAKVTTCATSPPQYEWIFEGTCTHFELKATGGAFALGKHDDITVSGSIGENNLKAPAIVYVADAIDKKDILTWKGKKFPPYTGKGTFIYAAAVNQGKATIIPKASKKPVLQYVINDGHGIHGTKCGEAVLAFSKGKFTWKPINASSQIKGNTVTITQFNAPPNFQLPPKTPLYFAVNCF